MESFEAPDPTRRDSCGALVARRIGELGEEGDRAVIRLELSDEEKQTLREMLERDLSDLRMEIAHTDRLSYRELLRERKRIIGKVIAALGQDG
jgi:hypothetical protein